MRRAALLAGMFAAPAVAIHPDVTPMAGLAITPLMPEEPVLLQEHEGKAFEYFTHVATFCEAKISKKPDLMTAAYKSLMASMEQAEYGWARTTKKRGTSPIYQIEASESTTELPQTERPKFVAGLKTVAEKLAVLEPKDPHGKFLIALAAQFKDGKAPEISKVKELLTEHEVPIELVERFAVEEQEAPEAALLEEKGTKMKARIFKDKQLVSKQKSSTKFNWGIFFNYLASLCCSCFVDYTHQQVGVEFTWAQFTNGFPNSDDARNILTTYRIEVDSMNAPTTKYQMPMRTTLMVYDRQNSLPAGVAYAFYRAGECHSVTTNNGHSAVLTASLSGCWMFVFKDPVNDEYEVIHCARQGGDADPGHNEAVAVRNGNGHGGWNLHLMLIKQREVAGFTNGGNPDHAAYIGAPIKCSYPTGGWVTAFWGVRTAGGTMDFGVTSTPMSGGVSAFQQPTVANCV